MRDGLKETSVEAGGRLRGGRGGGKLGWAGLGETWSPEMLGGSSLWGSAETNPTSSLRFRVRSLTLLSGLKIRHCHELQHRLPTPLGSGVAVAVV